MSFTVVSPVSDCLKVTEMPTTIFLLICVGFLSFAVGFLSEKLCRLEKRLDRLEKRIQTAPGDDIGKTDD